MSNLLMPVGVPQRAWTQVRMTETETSDQGPHQIVGTIGIQAVYADHGVMPVRTPSWIRTDKGIRRLQHQELAKAKGLLENFEMPTTKNKLRSVRNSTCHHIMTACLDQVGRWLDTIMNDKNLGETGKQRATPGRHPKAKDEPGWTDGENADDAEEWEWEVPELGPGSPWYADREANLREAVKDTTDPDQCYRDGLECLRHHRTNYTAAGPQRLQLLWWEFPRDHWTALREGCHLGFLISPKGELKLNGALTNEEREVAGRFVDELIGLGVLQEATEALIANCALFCVDKAYDSDQKRCIANCKEGGQNTCIGKDPVYLIQKEMMLMRLYRGGWTGISDG
jgi:hypothetical protein